MRRRDFIKGIVGSATAWPLAARAQQKIPRVGWIWLGQSAGNPPEVAGFRQGLRDFDYIEGQSINTEYRFCEGRIERIAGLVAELVQMQPDVLVALGSPVLSAVKNATSTIPIVMITGDPVGAGYVASLARPGGNVTGLSMMQGVEGLTGKRLEISKDALPAATRIGFMFNPNISTAVVGLTQAEQIARRLGITLRPVPVRRSDEIEGAITDVTRESVDGLLVETGAPMFAHTREIGRLVLEHRIPTITELRELVKAGGLVSYGPNVFEAARRQVYFVDRILKGAKPAELPVEEATKLELVINMKTARALGLTIPSTLIARADELIE